MSVPIVIPSHKRFDGVLTLKLFPEGILCVPESQYSEYKKNYPFAKFDVHPDSIVGISRKRNYIYQQYKDVVMIDDDLIDIKRSYLAKNSEKEKKLTAIECQGLVQDTYELAKAAGVKLFGFPLMLNPIHYSGAKPIMLGGFIAGGFQGLIWDSKLKYPEIDDFNGEDDYINLLNAYYNRFAWIDSRFTLFFKPQTSGGIHEYINKENIQNSIVKMRMDFGNSFNVVYDKNKENYTVKKNVSIWTGK